MTITSFTDTSKTYETTLTSCNCNARHFNPSKPCKHMRMIAQEVERAARFLAIKAQVERAEIEARENQACYERMMSAPW